MWRLIFYLFSLNFTRFHTPSLLHCIFIKVCALWVTTKKNKKNCHDSLLIWLTSDNYIHCYSSAFKTLPWSSCQRALPVEWHHVFTFAKLIYWDQLKQGYKIIPALSMRQYELGSLYSDCDHTFSQAALWCLKHDLFFSTSAGDQRDQAREASSCYESFIYLLKANVLS